MGGPAEMAFGWPLVTFFTLAVVASMAELASSLPTSGAMYQLGLGARREGMGLVHGLVQHHRPARRDCRYRLRVCAVCHAADGPRCRAPRNVFMVYGVILLSHALINHFGIRLVAWLNDFSVTVHIVGVIAVVGALMIFRPEAAACVLRRANHEQRRGLAVLVGVRRRTAAGDVDLHRLRRVGERIGRDDRSAAARAVGNDPGGRTSPAWWATCSCSR